MSDRNDIEKMYELTGLTRDLLSTGVRGTHQSLEERLASLPGARSDSVGGGATTRHGEERTRTGATGAANHGDPAGPLAKEVRMHRLEELAAEIRSCTRCPLGEGRLNAVPGAGLLDPLVMIIGEGPGAQEDQQGIPFVGRAGQYLDKWLSAIGLDRETNVFIANIVKCRPPNNRDPESAESDACRSYLDEQIDLVRPRMILTVGRISMRLLTGSEGRITRIHGSFYSYKGIPLVPTFHPSAVLRNSEYRRPVWDDLKTVRNWLVDNAGHSAPDIP